MHFLKDYIYVILLCFLVSLTVYSKPRNGDFYLKLFPPFLLVTLLVETWAGYMASIRTNNITVLNFFTVGQFCFYLFILSCIINHEKVKKGIRLTIFLYLITAILNILFLQGTKTIHTVTYSLGCLLVVACCIFYFLQLFMQKNHGKLMTSPPFWICFALLLYYSSSFPLIGLINYWKGISRFLIDNFALIVDILHIILYSLLTIAFLCRIRTRKYTLSPS